MSSLSLRRWPAAVVEGGFPVHHPHLSPLVDPCESLLPIVLVVLVLALYQAEDQVPL